LSDSVRTSSLRPPYSPRVCSERIGPPVELEGDRPLPAARAFVLQLHGGADPGRGRWAGRVSHVVSGRTAHFQTLTELAEFIERVLAASGAERRPDTPDEP